MELVVYIILTGIMALSSANQNCPDNLSQNCYCTDDNRTVYCKFNMNGSLEIFNSSIIQPISINMTKLDISDNNLTMLQTNFLDGINSLKELDLSKNSFSELPSILHMSIGSGIRKLNLSHNSLVHVDDLTFSSMNALEILDISYNHLNTVKDHAFVNNRYLWYLDLSHNNLDYLSSTNFQGLEYSIRDLDLSNNNLSELDRDTFSNLHNIKSLKMSKNSYSGQLPKVNFPQHIILLDLSESGIAEINECRLLQLYDLEYLKLNGNPLTCSCHLLWLHQRIVHNQETDNIHSSHSSENNDWTCIKIDGTSVKVADLHIDCLGHNMLINPDHCMKSEDLSSHFDEQKWKENLDFETEKGDNEVTVKWQGYNASLFYGYEIRIFDEKENIIYNSPTLHQTVTKYVAQSEELTSGTYQVCLMVFYNKTQIMGSVCNEISYVDLQIIVGILAGIIFLIPCVCALVYIIFLDKRKFMLHSDYSELTKSIENKDQKEKEKNEKKGSKQNPTKDRTAIPTITIHDYTSTNVNRTDSISPVDIHTFPMVRSTERILPDDGTSIIEPDGGSGSSVGIHIDIPSTENDTGLTNAGYTEVDTIVFNVKL